MLRVSSIFVADGAKTWLQGEDSLEVEPWSAGCGAWSCGWCFVRWLQFVQNLEELAHGVRPGHADILVLEDEEIAIPRPGLCLSFFRNKSRIAFLGHCASINYVRKVDVISAT